MTAKEKLQEQQTNILESLLWGTMDLDEAKKELMQLIELEPLNFSDGCNGVLYEKDYKIRYVKDTELFVVYYKSEPVTGQKTIEQAKQAAQKHYENQHYNKMKGGKEE